MNIFGIKPGVWFPVITLVLGAILKGLSDFFFENRRYHRESAMRLEQRIDAIQLRRVEFQRSTLLSLQESMQKLARATGRASHDDLMAFRKTNIWGRNFISEEANTAAQQAHATINMLKVRVLDREIRDVAEKFAATCASHVYCKNESESEACIREMFIHQSLLNEKIGDALRNLDELEDIAIKTQ